MHRFRRPHRRSGRECLGNSPFCSVAGYNPGPPPPPRYTADVRALPLDQLTGGFAIRRTGYFAPKASEVAKPASPNWRAITDVVKRRPPREDGRMQPMSGIATSQGRA